MDDQKPTQSESVATLAEALAKAQGQIGHAAKDKTNPFYKSTYADLASVMDAIRTPLCENGLSFIQRFPDTTINLAQIETVIMHASGEWISCGTIAVPVGKAREEKDGPFVITAQTFGSAVQYARRYALSTVFGVAAEEDDGNAASGKNQKQGPASQQTGTSQDPSPAQKLSAWAAEHKFAWPHVLAKVKAMGFHLPSLTADQANLVAAAMKEKYPEGDAGKKAQDAPEAPDHGAETPPAPQEPQDTDNAPPDPDSPEKPSYIVLAETWEQELVEGADITDLHDALLAAEGLTDEEREAMQGAFANASTATVKRKRLGELANRVLAVAKG